MLAASSGRKETPASPDPGRLWVCAHPWAGLLVEDIPQHVLQAAQCPHRPQPGLDSAMSLKEGRRTTDRCTGTPWMVVCSCRPRQDMVWGLPPLDIGSVLLT